MSIINKDKLIQLHVKNGLTYKEVAKELNTTMYWVRMSIKNHEIQPRKAGGRKGKPRSEETRNKISVANKGKTVSAEARIKMSESKKGSLNPRFGKKTKHGKRHWYKCPNGKIVSMRSTWEAAYAEHLDSEGVKWEYEPKTFILADGRAYTPDFYLTNEKVWVEVKGWLTTEHKSRMKQWQKDNPNEFLILADKEYLKSLGIDLKKKWVTSKPKFECLKCKKLFYRKDPNQRLCSIICRNKFIASGKKLAKQKKIKRKYNGNQTGSNNNCSKLTPMDIKEIREMKKSKMSVKEMAILKKTSISNIYNIIRGVSWKTNQQMN